jgi:hypothetical protein
MFKIDPVDFVELPPSGVLGLCERIKQKTPHEAGFFV